MKFFGGVRCGTSTKWLDFGGNPGQDIDPAFLDPDKISGSRKFSVVLYSFLEMATLQYRTKQTLMSLYKGLKVWCDLI